MSEWTRGTRILFGCLAVMVALAIGFGVYDDLHKTQIIDVQRKENYSLSDALTQAQKQLIDNGVKPNTKTPDEITKDTTPVAGTPGAVGERGPQGLPGVRGQTGEQGQPGVAGAAGVSGKDSTVPGPAGTAGTSGSDGVDGLNGSDSTVPGPVGPAGPAGPAGVAGAPGAAGEDGKSGADGRSVSSVQCVLDGITSYVVFYDQNQTEIGRVQSVCAP